ncbi:hypothetical protein V6N13_102573 [Hibiscus sabdariffa]
MLRHRCLQVVVCLSCKEEHAEEASKTKEGLKREIQDFKAYGLCSITPTAVPLPRPVLSFSTSFWSLPMMACPLFLFPPIKPFCDVSYVALRAFVGYLYTAEQKHGWTRKMACECDLLVLAEKYQVEVEHLSEKLFLVSELEWDNSLLTYAFAHRHGAKLLLPAGRGFESDYGQHVCMFVCM